MRGGNLPLLCGVNSSRTIGFNGTVGRGKFKIEDSHNIHSGIRGYWRTPLGATWSGQMLCVSIPHFHSQIR